MSRSRFWAALAAALTIALTASLAGPTDARADRCNPDEMIGDAYTLVTGQPYEPVFGEDDGPFCYAMKTMVYPAIGCDPVYQSLQACLLAQPGRVITFTSGTCYETLGELYDLADDMPYRLQQPVRTVVDAINYSAICGG